MIAPDARPCLLRGVRLREDPARGMILLGPERIYELDVIAATILQRCTGEVDFAAMIDGLTADFAADRAEVEADVTELLLALRDKQLLAL